MAGNVETFEQLNALYEWIHGEERRYAEDSRIFREDDKGPGAAICMQKSLAFYMCAVRLEETMRRLFG